LQGNLYDLKAFGNFGWHVGASRHEGIGRETLAGVPRVGHDGGDVAVAFDERQQFGARGQCVAGDAVACFVGLSAA
jgi:hypothetical protein